MSDLSLRPGELRSVFAARCHICKGVRVLESCATAQGARHMARNVGWAERGSAWTCPNCLGVQPKARG